MKQDRTPSAIRTLRPTTVLDTDVTEEMLRRATGRPLPQPTPTPEPEPVRRENLLARAMADTDTVAAGRSVGRLTYTADSGESVTIAVDAFLERALARVVHDKTMDARALAALEAGMVAGQVRTVTASGRRPLHLVRAEVSR